MGGGGGRPSCCGWLVMFLLGSGGRKVTFSDMRTPWEVLLARYGRHNNGPAEMSASLLLGPVNTLPGVANGALQV